MDSHFSLLEYDRFVDRLAFLVGMNRASLTIRRDPMSGGRQGLILKVPAPIAKAGKNDCASTGNNSCGGTSKVNADPKAWIYVPEGYCERIIGGSKTSK
jgi:hypothetical protein